MASDRPEWTRADYDGPTPPLTEFLAAYEQDDNVWWCVASGHHLNLFDAAVGEAKELRTQVARARERLAELSADYDALLDPYTARVIRDGLLEVLGEPDGGAE